MKKLWPSAGREAAYAAPIIPEAPGLFSTTKACFRRTLIAAAMARAVLSTAPPGAQGTMRVTGLSVFQACAEAAGLSSRQPMPNKAVVSERRILGAFIWGSNG
ncbi:hypothetical protein D3C71_1871870 [compost metagenome]